MSKVPIVICANLLIGLLSLIPQAVSANVGTAVFCPNNFQEGTDTNNEIILSRATCAYIRDMLAAKYGGCYDSFDANCTVERYVSILSTLKTSFNKAVVFSKGHRGYPYWNASPPNWNHMSLLSNNGAPVIDNVHILPYTSTKNVFTFIWHCETAEKYPAGALNPDSYGYYGMPYCWTTAMDPLMYPYATSGIRVYLGWWDGSPQFEYTANGMWNFAHVAYLFWYFMCGGATVNEALNYIAQTVYGVQYFSQTPLWWWLIAFGNVSLTLP
ncbi:MAG: hypothetical protein QW744_03295 [Candidatus Bathyarchaeia archaeon]